MPESAHRNVDVNKLAAAGFYYGTNGTVCCAFCDLNFDILGEVDDPKEYHKRSSPLCKFVEELNEGNVPMEPNDPPNTSENDHSQGVDECGLYGITPCDPAINVSLERLGICRRYDPSHPSYATLESRLASFCSWPLRLKLRPEALSEAGFYYTGAGDRTICFQCGGGLKDWEETDDPWKEHAKYFSQCSFVLQNKGRDFIEAVVRGDNFEDTTSCRDNNLSEDVLPASSLEATVGSQGSDASSSGYSSTSSSFGDTSAGTEDKQIKAEKKPLDDRNACKVCYDEEIGVVFLPCGHLVACVKCAPALKTCAVCRKPFSATVRAYLS